MAEFNVENIEEFSIPEINKRELKKQEDLLAAEWDTAVNANEKSLFNKWILDRKSKGQVVNYKTLEEFQFQLENQKTSRARAATGGNYLKDSDWNTIDQKDPMDLEDSRDHEKIYNDFLKFKNKRNKERFMSLSEEGQKIELDRGGVYNENLDWKAFSDTFVDHLTLGFADLKHPVYEKAHRANSAIASTTGALAGELTNFLLLSSLSGGLGTSKAIFSLGRKSKTASKMLRGVGYLPHHLNKMKKSFHVFNAFSRKSASAMARLDPLVMQGANTTTMGMLYMFRDSARAMSTKYLREDELSPAEYEKQVPKGLFQWTKKLAESFVAGSTLHVINQPAHMSIRFAGDAMWSSANQGWRVLTGQQKTWDNKQFLMDFVIGNFLGEIQQGAFAPPRKVKRRMFKKDPGLKHYYDIAKNDKDLADLNPDKDMLFNIAAQSRLTQDKVEASQGGTPASVEQRQAIYQITKEPFKENYDLLVEFQKPNAKTIKLNDLIKDNVEPVEQSLKVLGRLFKLNKRELAKAKEEGILDNIEIAKRYAPKKVKEKKEIQTDYTHYDLDPTTSTTFRNVMEKVKNEHVLKGGKDAELISKLDLEKLIRHRFEDTEKYVDYEALSVKAESSLNKTTRYKDDAGNIVVEKIKLTPEDIDLGKQLLKKVQDKVVDKNSTIHKSFKDNLGDLWSFLTEDISFDYIARIAKKVDKNKLDAVERQISIDVAKSIKDFNYKDLGISLDQRVGTGKGDETIPLAESKIAEDTVRSDIIAAREELPINTLEIKPAFEGYPILQQRFKEVDADKNGKLVPTMRKNKGYIKDYQHELSLLKEISKKSPTQFKNAILTYMSFVRGMSPDGASSYIKKKTGLYFSPDEILSAVKNTSPGREVSKKAVLDALGEQYSYLIRKISSGKYSDKDIESFLKRLQSRRQELNPITGIDANIKNLSTKMYVKEKGAFILSFKDIRSKIITKYGIAGADNINRAIGKYINRYINLKNAEYARDGLDGKVFLKNPTANDGTDFIIYSKGVPNKDISGYVTHLYNVLRNRYTKDQLGVDGFAITIKHPDGKTFSLDKFGEVLISRTKNPDNLTTVSNTLNTLLNNVKAIDNELGSDLLKKFNNVVFDESKLSADKLQYLKNLDIKNDENVIDTMSVIEEIINTMPRVSKSKPLVEVAKAETENDSLITPSARYTAAINQSKKNNFKDVNPDSLSTFMFRNSQEDTEFSQSFVSAFLETKSISDDIVKEIFGFTKRFESQRDPSFFDKHLDSGGVLGGVSKSINFTKKLWQEKTDQYIVTSGKEQQVPNGEYMLRLITGQLGDMEEASVKLPLQWLEMTYKDFYINNLRGDEHMIDIYRRMKLFVKENEYKSYYKNESTGELVKDLYNRLQEPIKWKKGKYFAVDEKLRSPEGITADDMVNIRFASNDEFVLSKILVQKLGITPEQLVKQQTREKTVFEEPLNRIYNRYRISNGDYRESNVIDRAIDNSNKKVAIALQSTSLNKEFLKSLDVRVDAHFTKVKEGIEELKLLGDIDGAAKVDRISRQVKEIDPDKWSYVFHRMVSDPANEKPLKGIVEKFLEGEGRRGAGVLSTSLNEMQGRSEVSLFSLAENNQARQMSKIKTDYPQLKVEMDSFVIEHGQIGYILTAIQNVKFRDNLKMTFAKRMVDAYKPIFETEAQINTLKGRKKNPNTKLQEMSALVDKKDKQLEEFIRFFDELDDGYLYMPVSKEFTTIKNSIKELETTKDLLIEKGLAKPDEISKIEENIVRENERLNTIEFISSVLTGKGLVKEKKDLNKLKAKSMDSDSFDLKDANKLVDKEATAWNGRIAQRVDPSNNGLMPIDKVSWENDTKYRVKRGEFARAYDLIPFLRKDRENNTERIMTQDKRRNLQSKAVKGFDGLFVPPYVMQMFKEYIFRDSYYDKGQANTATRQLVAFLDNTNSTMKIVRLVKPTLMITNNAAQAVIDSGLHGLPVPFTKGWSNYKFGYNAVMNKNTNTKESEFYYLMNRNNLYNKTSGFGSVFKDAAMAGMDIIGTDKKYFGLNPYFKTIKDAFKSGRSKKEKAWKGLSTGFRGYQEVAWVCDEIMRTSVAKGHFDRLMATGNYSKDTAAFAAAERTNRAMVQYSRMTVGKKRMLNRMLMYPTYRMGTFRLYKDLIKEAVRGGRRMLGSKDVITRMRVSDSEFKQGLFEVAPLVRALSVQLGVKALVGFWFGFGAEDTQDFITNYRLRKVKKGLDQLDTTMQYISFGTPLFDWNKYLSRDMKTILKYNMASIPGLFYAMYNNENIYTGEQIVTADISKNTSRATCQLLIDTLQTYIPFGSDLGNLLDEDKSFIGKIINFSGMAYYYDAKSPRRMKRDFLEAISAAKTKKERIEATTRFKKEMSRVSSALLGKTWEDANAKLERAYEEDLKKGL